MKVTKEKFAANREALIKSASKLFQERGFDGAGVAEISAKAGLTQGGFYGQFESKSALAVEACKKSHVDGKEAWAARTSKTGHDLTAYLDQYLSVQHLDDVATGCPMAAYASEIRRQDLEVQEAFAAGFEQMVTLMTTALLNRSTRKESRRLALTLVSAMAGSLSMARAVEGCNPRLANEILSAARREFERFATNASTVG